MSDYDSTVDTQKHISQVQVLIAQFQAALDDRLSAHDRSKMQTPEKEMFDEYTPKLRALTYGSDEYKECLKQMGVALKHHYENNTHHPEHYDYWRCQICKSVFKNPQVDSRFVEEIRLCPKCCEYGTIMEAALVPEGVYGMSLLDVFEMLADWKAATLRHADGDIFKSIEINKGRFNLSDQLANILLNTAYEMGWLVGRQVEGGG